MGVIIENPQSWNRFSYVQNNPIIYNDPSGHWLDVFVDLVFIVIDVVIIIKEGPTKENMAALAADAACAIAPFATGGGQAVRAGYKGVQAVTKTVEIARTATAIPEAVRWGQLATKGIQGFLGMDSNGPSSSRSDPDQAKKDLTADDDPFTDHARNQLEERGWTEEEALDVKNNPDDTFPGYDTKPRDGSAKTTVYEKGGNQVVARNDNGQIIHISNKLDPDWKMIPRPK